MSVGLSDSGRDHGHKRNHRLLKIFLDVDVQISLVNTVGSRTLSTLIYSSSPVENRNAP